MSTRRLASAALLGLALAACARLPGAAVPQGHDWAAALPAVEPDASLPERSARLASYTIAARLDPEEHTLDGALELEWTNASEDALSAFPFHLYWNAFRNNLSTHARGERRRTQPPRSATDPYRGLAYVHVKRIALVANDGSETDLGHSLRYLHPDDDNDDDRSVIEVTTPEPVPAGAVARFRIEWSSRIPYGDAGRAGWVHDYHFVAQWFPKIGVYRDGAWNCHQFHANSEFFADFGNYDVRLTLPAGFVVGATGRLVEKTANPDGSESFRFTQEDVHDFVWTASRRFLERTARFEHPGYPPVEIRLLLQPEHELLAERHLEATRTAIRAYGAWSTLYPYGHVTVVDPAWNSGSGGMEYPTLFTAGTGIYAPKELHSPESVTIHEMGHQFWYGLVAPNEFEEAWLDEGINEYLERRTRWLALGPETWGVRYFGLPEWRRSGWPVLAREALLPRGGDSGGALRARGETDVMARAAWEYRTPQAYTVNSYDKPALVLQTLEALLGAERMDQVLREWGRRFRFRHPKTEDFLTVVDEVTGEDWRWFFDETFFSSELCDYAVEVNNVPSRRLDGYTEGPDGAPVLVQSDSDTAPQPAPEQGEVSLLRLGGVRMPLELEVRLADGRRLRERWDGRERWTRFRYDTKVVEAVADPEHKLAIDVDKSNNAWTEERQARRAAAKWAARWMLWLQSLLEAQLLLG